MSLNSGVITVPVPQTMYQQVVANMQSGDSTGAIQVVGTPVDIKGETTAVVGKVEHQREGETVTVTTAGGNSGLTITPVATTAAQEQGTIYHVRSNNEG